MVLHGFEVTDPIRNFTDYGFTMCSTVSGINQSLYEMLGLRHQYWDICNHTVSAVEYDGRFHMVDSSMSNLVTTDDGVDAGVGARRRQPTPRGWCASASLYSTSANGFLTGTDRHAHILERPSARTTAAIVKGFADNFCESGLKYRDYYYNWNAGHRYVLNLREHESYTRYYRRLGTDAGYWVGCEKVASPDPANTFEIDAANRFGIRGNGELVVHADADRRRLGTRGVPAVNIAVSGGGLQPAVARRPGRCHLQGPGGERRSRRRPSGGVPDHAMRSPRPRWPSASITA